MCLILGSVDVHKPMKKSVLGSLIATSIIAGGCGDETDGGRGSGAESGFSASGSGADSAGSSTGDGSGGGSGGGTSAGESATAGSASGGGTGDVGTDGISGGTASGGGDTTGGDPGTSGPDGSTGGGGSGPGTTSSGGGGSTGADSSTSGGTSAGGTTGEGTTSGGLVGTTGNPTTGGGLRFDVGGGGTGGTPDECEKTGPGTGVGGDVEFSYIWIANTAEGTVSKIDTMSGNEEARYRTGPDLNIGGNVRNPDPSRTSVNLYGDVAIANRTGSLTKIATREEDCIDRNGNMQIDTSTGPNDILDWMQDECVLWWVDLPFSPSAANSGNRAGPRAVAWDGGSGDICANDAKVWIAGRTQEDATTATVQRYNGDGTFDAEVVINSWTPSNWGHGPYGGATDAEGNFWILGADGFLIFVDAVTVAASRYNIPDDEGKNTYGLALDAEGDVWVSGHNGVLWRFDTGTRTFHNMADVRRMRGVAIDFDGQLWAAANNGCGLVHYDTITETMVDANIALPDCDEPVGVSIDVDGFVWVVDRFADRAYKVNPTTHAIADQTLNLNRPYTYSDMTGAGLSLVVGPPG